MYLMSPQKKTMRATAIAMGMSKLTTVPIEATNCLIGPRLVPEPEYAVINPDSSNCAYTQRGALKKLAKSVGRTTRHFLMFTIVPIYYCPGKRGDWIVLFVSTPRAPCARRMIPQTDTITNSDTRPAIITFFP